jgi:hypothetical protein
MKWRRRAVFTVAGLWSVVCVARLSRLGEPPESPPGDELVPLLDFLRQTIPPDAGYLLVLPGAFGTDTGTAPRLRYELAPRPYDDIRADVDEAQAHQLMTAEGLRYVVVPDATLYPTTSWLREPRPWLRQLPFDTNRYVLEVVA